MAVTFYCPSCRSALSIRDDAPEQFTCPVCLAQIANPMARAPLPVLPVAPVEREARRDAHAVRWVLIFIVLLLGAAVLVTATTAGASNTIFHVLILLLVVAFVGIGIFEGGQRNAMTRRAEAEAAERAMRAAQEQGAAGGEVGGAGGTLDYRASRGQYWGGREPVGGGAVAGGLFASLGVCATGFLILLGTLDTPHEQHGTVLLGVVLMVLAYMFAAPFFAGRRGWRGFGLGATIGMALGLCALGPCAFCYTMTL